MKKYAETIRIVFVQLEHTERWSTSQQKAGWNEVWKYSQIIDELCASQTHEALAVMRKQGRVKEADAQRRARVGEKRRKKKGGVRRARKGRGRERTRERWGERGRKEREGGPCRSPMRGESGKAREKKEERERPKALSIYDVPSFLPLVPREKTT